jgi:hypothetical protein
MPMGTDPSIERVSDHLTRSLHCSVINEKGTTWKTCSGAGKTLEEPSTIIYEGRFFHVVKSIAKPDKIVKLIQKIPKGLLNSSHK